MTQLTTFIKEFITAYGQGSTIYNCREGSLAWWHEKGHIKRFQNQKIRSFYGHLIFYSTPALFFSYNYLTVFNTIAVFWALALLCFEIDAWIYAVKKYFSKGAKNEH